MPVNNGKGTDSRPTGSGFDKFYRFMGGETNPWAPAIYDGMTKIEVPKDPNCHFMTGMTNQAIKWMKSVKPGIVPARRCKT